MGFFHHCNLCDSQQCLPKAQQPTAQGTGKKQPIARAAPHRIMTCIDHCIRPPRLIMVAALLSITISLPATAAVSFFSTDTTTKNIAITTSKMNMNMNMRNIFHSSRRKLQLTTTTTNNSADDEIDAYKLLQKKKGINATTTVSLATKHVDTTTTTNYSYNNNNELCTPMEECELCPHKWKQLLDKDDEKIEGEFESCVKYGRRQQFKCTVLFQGELFVFVGCIY